MKKVLKTKLTDEEERIGASIVGAAYHVHKALGPGLLEKVYEVCFCHELAKRDLRFERQVTVPIVTGIEVGLLSKAQLLNCYHFAIDETPAFVNLRAHLCL